MKLVRLAALVIGLSVIQTCSSCQTPPPVTSDVQEIEAVPACRGWRWRVVTGGGDGAGTVQISGEGAGSAELLTFVDGELVGGTLGSLPGVRLARRSGLLCLQGVGSGAEDRCVGAAIAASACLRP